MFTDSIGECMEKDKWTLNDSNINLPAILNDPRYGRRDKQIDIFSRVSQIYSNNIVLKHLTSNNNIISDTPKIFRHFILFVILNKVKNIFSFIYHTLYNC